MVSTYKTDDINDLSAEEANAIIGAVKITIDAIEANAIELPNKDILHKLLKSAHRKLTNKDEGIIQRVN